MKISEIGKVVTGKTPSTKNPLNYSNEIPFITVADLSKNGLIKNTERYISKIGYDSIKNNCISGISIPVACVGEIGSVGITTIDCATNQQINTITEINENICNPYYLYFKLKLLKKKMENLAGQTVLKILPKSVFEEIEIDLPTLHEQNLISDLLWKIESKIVINNHINSELESMAKTLYDYWFLQFEFPNEEGKPYKSSGGKMVYNEELKREIPEGWEISDMKPYIDIVRGVAYKPEDISETEISGYVPLLKSNNLQNGKILFDEKIYVPKKLVEENQYLDNNSLFVTMSSGSAEHVGKVALVPYDTGHCYGAFCSKIKVRSNVRCYISQYFLSNFFKQKIRTIVVGTSIKNISNEHMLNNIIPIPDKHILDKYETIVNPIYNKMATLIKENRQLAELRDFLLPMLMNGQVTFKNEKNS